MRELKQNGLAVKDTRAPVRKAQRTTTTIVQRQDTCRMNRATQLRQAANRTVSGDSGSSAKAEPISKTSSKVGVKATSSAVKNRPAWR